MKYVKASWVFLLIIMGFKSFADDVCDQSRLVITDSIKLKLAVLMDRESLLNDYDIELLGNLEAREINALLEKYSDADTDTDPGGNRDSVIRP